MFDNNRIKHLMDDIVAREHYSKEDVDELNGLWMSYLDEFENKFYPVFDRRGFSLPEALNCFLLNRVSQLLMMEEDDGREPWRGP